jgi:hypothetical protein
LKCNGFRSESFFPFCCACIPPATEPVADARSPLDISVAQAEANVCQAAAELRSYLSKLQRGDLCNFLNAVDPNFRRQQYSFTKMELVEKVFELPYTQWSEIFSVKPRVTSLAGPGLAHFSYAGQFSRRDDDDFWFFEPPKTVARQNSKQRHKRLGISCLVDAGSITPSQDHELMQENVVEGFLDSTVVHFQSHDDNAVAASDNSNILTLQNDAALHALSVHTSQTVASDPGGDLESHYQDDNPGNVEPSETDPVQLSSSTDFPEDCSNAANHSSGGTSQSLFVEQFVLEMGDYHSAPIIARPVSR